MMKHVLLSLLLVGCVGEISSDDTDAAPPPTYDNEPPTCKQMEIICEYGNASTRTGWHCYWQNLCWPEDEPCDYMTRVCWDDELVGHECKYIPSERCV